MELQNKHDPDRRILGHEAYRCAGLIEEKGAGLLKHGPSGSVIGKVHANAQHSTFTDLPIQELHADIEARCC